MSEREDIDKGVPARSDGPGEKGSDGDAGPGSDPTAPADDGDAGQGRREPSSGPPSAADRSGRRVEHQHFERDGWGRDRTDRERLTGRPSGRPGGPPRGRGGRPGGPGGAPPRGRGGPPRDRGGQGRGGPGGSWNRSPGGPRPYAANRAGPGRPDGRGGGDRRGPSYGRPRPDQRSWSPPPAPRGPSPAELLSENEEVVAGRRPVEEAFAARRAALRLLVVPERRDALDQLVLHATTLRIPVVEVEGGTLTSVSGFDGHQGVALVVEPRQWATVDDVLAAAKSAGEPPLILVLDHLEDPQNVGTLLRSAEAAGVHGVVFPTRGSAPFSPAALKASAGAIEHIRLVPTTDLAGLLVDLHAKGLRVVGADGDAELTIREADLRGPIAIVVGSEGRGLQARTRKRVDLFARIPMRGKVGSLNASVAGSVFLFEAAAQRGPAAPVLETPAEARAEDAMTAPAESDPADASGADPGEVSGVVGEADGAAGEGAIPEAAPAMTEPVADLEEALLPELGTAPEGAPETTGDGSA